MYCRYRTIVCQHSMSLCVAEEEIGLKGENAVCFLMQFNCYFSFPVLITFIKLFYYLSLGFVMCSPTCRTGESVLQVGENTHR